MNRHNLFASALRTQLNTQPHDGLNQKIKKQLEEVKNV
jgi:hypothetical protein